MGARVEAGDWVGIIMHRNEVRGGGRLKLPPVLELERDV